MTGTRLATIAQDLAIRLKRATDDELRAIALAACRHAIACIGISDQAIADGLQSIEAGQYGDTPVRSALQVLTKALDETAWDIQEMVDEEHADQAAYLTAFSKARAANAVYSALDADPATGAMEAVYEANAATDDLAYLRRIVLSCLGQ